ISNLLNNAINFTEQGTVSLQVQAKTISERKMKVQFIIQDTGIGIAPERQEKIFEPYVQAASNTTRHYGGIGLGLPIVRKVLAMFDSDVKLESEPNKGTKTSFELELNYEKLPFSLATNCLNVDTNLGKLQ